MKLWLRGWPGWLFCTGFLVAGVPLFLRMPPWCDLTLYEVAARNVMAGGTHYKDVFDTNPPGFVWCLVAVRRLFGGSWEAVRAVDLGIVVAICYLLIRIAKRAGATPAGAAWFAAAAALFYPFTFEYVHCQRDVWMLLPAVAATWLRVRRAGAMDVDPFRPAVVEGLIWGFAMWIKPHCLFPVLFVWLFTARRVAVPYPRPWRAARRDGLGYLCGGVAAGVAGYAWLVLTGASGPFWEVFTKWNNGYAQYLLREIENHPGVELLYFPPFSLFIPVAVVLAVRVFVSPWSQRWFLLDHFFPAPAEGVRPAVPERAARWGLGYLFPSVTADEAAARQALAALFLGWAGQAIATQRMFHYVHAPEIFLLLAVGMAVRFPIAFLSVVYTLVLGGVWLLADTDPKLEHTLRNTEGWSIHWSDQYGYVPRHALFLPDRWRQWGRCFDSDPGETAYRERMYRTALFADTFPSIDPVQIGEVADELRRLGAAEGEVLAWHDSPHAVYLELGHRPPLRFMHINTCIVGVEQYERMKRELIKLLAAGKVKYIVSDLTRVYAMAPDKYRVGKEQAGPDLLPPKLLKDRREVFPLDRPAVFRSGGGKGRYLIHVMTGTFGPFDNCYVLDEWPTK